MEKLSYFCGVKSIPSTWQPCHVEEIISYLNLRGYHFECYKERSSSKYILVCNNVVSFYKRSAELCESLIDTYFEEKNIEEVEFFKERNVKALKQNYFSKGEVLKCHKMKKN